MLEAGDAAFDVCLDLALLKRLCESIPETQHDAIIGVGLFYLHGMMDAVHARRDQDPTQRFVEHTERKIAVMKLCDRDDECVVDQQLVHFQTQHRN
jgi:hypothetical protein